jgi:hypothetical protein
MMQQCRNGGTLEGCFRYVGWFEFVEDLQGCRMVAALNEHPVDL